MKYPVLLIFCALSFAACHRKKAADFTLPFYTNQNLGPVWIDPRASTAENPHRIGNFRLTTQTGAACTEKDLDGKISVVHFFFTHCAGICPKVVGNVKKVPEALPGHPGLIFLSLSVTPEIDNPVVLRDYARDRSLPGSWLLLTGSRETIYSLARKSFFADEDLGKPVGRDDFLHSENVYLLDGKRRIRGLYKGTFEPDILRLIEDIRILEKEGP